jgi:hypothetical protein
MRIKETKVYTCSELSETAQERAISKLSHINVDFEWWKSVYEDAKNVGLKLTSFDLDRNRHAEGSFLFAANEVAQNIFNNHGKDCESYKTATEFMKDWQPVFNNYMDESHKDYESRECEEKLQNIEDEFLKSLLEDYSIILQHEYEYLTSSEAIKEAIECNGYEFTEDGKLA